MLKTSQLISQTLLYSVIGGIIGLLLCATLIWSVNTVWHPEMGIGQEGTTGLKALTIFIFYLPLGLLLGAATALIEPINDTSFREALVTHWRWLLIGALLGALGMVIGGFIGEWIFDQLSSLDSRAGGTLSKLGRILGTMVMGVCLGCCLGLIDRIRTKSNDRFVAGMFGGGLGGTIAALLFQFVIVWPELMPIVPTILLAMFAIGAIGSVTYLKTKGALVGGIDKTLFKYASPAWRKPLLSDAPNYIGSGRPGFRSPQATFMVANDQDVVMEHAIIQMDKKTKRWVLQRWSADAVKLLVNGHPLAGDTVELGDGNILTFGGTRFRLELKK